MALSRFVSCLRGVTGVTLSSLSKVLPIGTNNEFSSTVANDDDMVVPKEEVVRFIVDCMRNVGTTADDAWTVGHHLMTADYRGHFSHGMNRVHMYINDIQNGTTNPIGKPELITDFQAIALVDGKNALGQVVGKYCMELAIEKARKFGIAMISARGTNHYGICGYYALMAIEQGMIGFTCTNTSPLMVPTRSTQAALGTNPLAFGIGTNRDQFLLDMATTAVAVGKIELAARKNEPIPEGWALGHDGNATTNAREAADAGLLMPLGGREENSGYKGYGLALMVEILCGVLSGSHYGPGIRSWTSGNQVADLGQCFMVVDPRTFASGSKDRLDDLLGQLRKLPTIGEKNVLVAGDPEREAMAEVDRMGGLSYHRNQLVACEQMAKELGVEPMKLVPRIV